MSIPANFSGMPQEQLHHHFRNVCLEFKKVVKSSKDVEELELQMDRFMNVFKGMDWPHKNSDVLRKNPQDKVLNRLITEYKRYLEDLRTNAEKALPQDLINALSEAEGLLETTKVG